jgi:hypothetical protein
MKYTQFRETFAWYDVRDRTMIRAHFPDLDPRRLSERKKKWYIINIIQGWRCFGDSIQDESSLYKIANHIYKPSYISLHSALRHYNLIPETVYTITSVTTRKTQKFITPIAPYIYQTIHSKLFTGYTILTIWTKKSMIAKPAKAICDFLYLYPSYNSIDAFDERRIQTDELTQLCVPWDFTMYIPLYNQTTQWRIRLFISYIRSDA